MTAQSLASVYDAFYYRHYDVQPYERTEALMDFFRHMAGAIDVRIMPRTALDAGCALGFLVECLRARGIEAFGLDLSEYAIANVHESVAPYCFVSSITEPFPQRYDLITCIEVTEHLPPSQAERAVENLCAHTDDILFSSTPLRYDDATHLNVRPPDYWAELFAYQGFYRDADFDAGFICPWAARFRRSRDPIARVIGAYERRLWHLEKDSAGQHEISLAQKRQLAEQQAQIIEQQAQIEKQKEQIESDRQKNEQLQVELALWQDNLSGANQKNEQLQIELVASQDNLHRANQKNEQLQAESAALQDHVNDANQRSEQLRAELAALHENIKLINDSTGWKALQVLWRVRRWFG